MAGDNSAYAGGIHAVKALLKSNAQGTRSILVQRGRNDSRLRSLVDLARRADIRVLERSRKDLDKLAGGIEHQGVLAEYSGRAAGTEQDLLALLDTLSGPALLLVLDGVQDPHNLGACLRSADAAGAHAVVVPVDNSAGVTPVVRKVASGAAESMPLFQVTNLQRTLSRLQQAGVWVYGAAGDANAALHQMDWRGPVAIVMGSEGSGLRRLTRESCDELFSIPMLGTVQSLNVSVATGVTLYEIVRQRQQS